MIQSTSAQLQQTLLPIAQWLWPFIVGTGLGLIFFAGLWWTVKKIQTSSQPAGWLIVSFALRIAVVVYGVYWVSNGQWQRALACTLGILFARFIVLRLTHVSRSQVSSYHNSADNAVNANSGRAKHEP
ncbi:ATP synthase subunit I [Arsukibacterium sp. MJ3]|uniref:ATP synthase subunit I n=1 Tax=Arsukibacterium sp. MJ3 TaxID=1632859 RepID=UPI0009E546AD|nr:ATP synthase subunit I [Arsukibacterium sp. MJ3]